MEIGAPYHVSSRVLMLSLGAQRVICKSMVIVRHVVEQENVWVV